MSTADLNQRTKELSEISSNLTINAINLSQKHRMISKPDMVLPLQEKKLTDSTFELGRRENRRKRKRKRHSRRKCQIKRRRDRIKVNNKLEDQQRTFTDNANTKNEIIAEPDVNGGKTTDGMFSDSPNALTAEEVPRASYLSGLDPSVGHEFRDEYFHGHVNPTSMTEDILSKEEKRNNRRHNSKRKNRKKEQKRRNRQRRQRLREQRLNEKGKIYCKYFLIII